MGTGQADLTGSREPLRADCILGDGEPVSGEGVAARVGELATRAVELTTDVGTQQAYLAAGREALKRADGNKSQAARLLGLTRNALRYRLTQMGLES